VCPDGTYSSAAGDACLSCGDVGVLCIGEARAYTALRKSRNALVAHACRYVGVRAGGVRYFKSNYWRSERDLNVSLVTRSTVFHQVRFGR
jgi:hypothetical protein